MQHRNRRPPLLLYETILKKLDPERLRLILRDHRLIRQGYHFYFATDHFEISRYCFPIDPDRIGQYSDEEINDISEEQNAYFEFFHAMKFKPVLLEEYTDELQGLTRYLESTTEYTYSQADIIEKYVEIVGIEETDLESITDVEEIIGFLKDNFNNVLAVASGVYSIGTQRLSEIVRERLLDNELDGEDKLLVNLDTVETTEKSDLFFQILQDVNHDGVRRTNGGSMRKVYNDRRDASVIDKILQLNKQLIKKKVFIAYFSSAPKSLRLFQHPDMQELQPVVQGERHSILRTTRDLYAYLVRKGSSEIARERNLETIKQIQETLDLIDKVEAIKGRLKTIENKCIPCSRNQTRYFDCEFRSICDGLQKYAELLNKYRRQRDNISLVASLSDFMKQFKKVRKKDPYSYYLEFLKVINTEETREAALKEMQTIHELIRMKSYFVSSIPIDLSNLPPVPPTSKDYVTCILQEFPLRLRIKSEPLNRIVENVNQYVLTPRQEKAAMLSLISSAFGEYLKFDAKLQTDPESDLVRSYLYLVLGRKQLIRTARGIATKLLDTAHDREARYLLSFISRYLGEFAEVHKYVSQACEKYPEDPRFYHARCLNTFAWLQTKGVESAGTAADAIEDCQLAIEYYKHDSQMAAVNYNNLAYLYSYERSESYDVNKALEYLQELKSRIPEDEWDPNYPEFYDTQATVYYEYWLNNKDKGEALEKLRSALHSIKKAIDIYSKPLYREKKSEIERELSKAEAKQIHR